jgi:hypothetical protein
MKIPTYIRKQVDGKRRWIKVGHIHDTKGYWTMCWSIVEEKWYTILPKRDSGVAKKVSEE